MSSNDNGSFDSDCRYSYGHGLYRPFVDYAVKQLGQSGLFAGESWFDIPSHLRTNVVPAKGRGKHVSPKGTIVRIETTAFHGHAINVTNTTTSSSSCITYARYALLETLVPSSSSDKAEEEQQQQQHHHDEEDADTTTSTTNVFVQVGDENVNDGRGNNDVTAGTNHMHLSSNTTTTSSDGIQVLNFVIFPSSQTCLPVWGADLVSLPGNKHLLVIDVQPMIVMANTTTTESTTMVESLDKNDTKLVLIDKWKQYYDEQYAMWYDQHVIANNLTWGGDFPLEAKKFFSPHCLWTRLSCSSSSSDDNNNNNNNEGNEDMSPIEQIQTQIYNAFCDSLQLYLQMVHDYMDIVNHGSNSDDDGQQLSEEQPLKTKQTKNHQEEYVRYRLANDPARPMLTSLYGTNWTEEVLTKVLFPLDRLFF